MVDTFWPAQGASVPPTIREMACSAMTVNCGTPSVDVHEGARRLSRTHHANDRGAPWVRQREWRKLVEDAYPALSESAPGQHLSDDT